MAIISPNTFEPLRRYISVRLQQGVPIVDADWNEMEDVRRFELRAFLKWYVGDGVPDGTNAFAIVATGSASTFTIQAEVAASGLAAGRYLVDGLDVLIAAPVDFAAQPLHESQPGAAALAAAWGVPTIAAIPAPPVAGTTQVLTAYLDVWERSVGTAEDPSLVHPGLGTESCARIKREWAVRVRGGTTVPVSGNPDFLAGHAYSALARIVQPGGAGAITADSVVDLRRRALRLTSGFDLQQTVADAFGTGYAFGGDGQPTLQVSLRDALNAVLSGQLPLTPEIPLFNTGLVSPSIHGLFAIPSPARPTQEIMLIWSGEGQLQSLRANLAGPIGAPARITADTASEAASCVVADGQNTWLFWKSDRKAPGTLAAWAVYARQYVPGQGWGAIVELGDARASGGPYLDQSAELAALRDPVGQIWFAWVHRDGLVRLRRLAGGTAGPALRVSDHPGRYAGTFSEQAPTMIAINNTTVQVFWEDVPPYTGQSTHRIWSRAYDLSASNNWVARTPLRFTSDSGYNDELTPRAFSDGRGGDWLFWLSRRQNGPSSMGLFPQASPTLSGTTVFNLSLESERTVPVVLGATTERFPVFFAPIYDGESLRYKVYDQSSRTWGEVREFPTMGDQGLPIAAVSDGAGGAFVAYFRRAANGNAELTLRKIFGRL